MNNETSTNCVFPVSDIEQVKEKVLNWLLRFDTFCFLDNHQYQLTPHAIECMAAAGARRWLECPAGEALETLQQFINEGEAHKPWLFGHLGYDLKNEIERLSSGHPDETGFPDLFFFEPQTVVRFSETEMIIEAEDPGAVYQAIQEAKAPPGVSHVPVRIHHRISREEYIRTITELKQHILRGDCYEVNFCQEFFTHAAISPLNVYRKLSRVSPNPFSALYRVKDQWLMCASPERFLQKTGNRIMSQPIKGTSGRELHDQAADQRSREELYHSAKDRSENVMVVDLVRNDLARICEEGSVQVDELYGIYSFPQVHQMISTISGRLRADTCFADIIRATFPMGSMTGAPKKRVMELIEQYEQTRRGIFSGAVGYISPKGDFDFNVVIRSIMYNARNQYLSYQAGSGITFYSDPEKEWDECLLKAAAIRNVLEDQGR